MQALGLIETRGLLSAIECADAMLKTAQVELLERTLVGGGYVAIVVNGDVGAVKAAVEAGVAAVEKFGPMSLISHHIIPRPHPDIRSIVLNNPLPKQSMATEPTELIETSEPMVITTESPTSLIALKDIHKEELDTLVGKFGLEKSVNALNRLSVVKLRKLAREYKELGVAGRAISKADKELLIKKIREYYQGSNE